MRARKAAKRPSCQYETGSFCRATKEWPACRFVNPLRVTTPMRIMIPTIVQRQEVNRGFLRFHWRESIPDSRHTGHANQSVVFPRVFVRAIAHQKEIRK